MGAVAHAEILDRRGRVIRRAALSALPALVGRGLDCDVIIDDPHVDPTHLCIERDDAGGLVARDLGSLNGSFVRGGRGRRAEIPLAGEPVLRIGHTWLRVRPAGAAVPPARRDTRHGLSALVRSRALAPLLVAASAGVIVLDRHLSIYEHTTPAELAAQSLGTLLALALWAGGWALVNRIVSHDFRFFVHWAIASVAVAITAPHAVLLDTIYFVTSPDALPALLGEAGWALFLAALLAAHLSVFSTLSAARLAVACLLVSTSVVGGIALFVHGSRGFDASREFPSQIRPIGLTWLPAVSTERYYGQVGALKTRVDRLVAEAADTESDEGS